MTGRDPFARVEGWLERIEAWLERAAICEYDGELTREEAEALAEERHPGGRPPERPVEPSA